MKWLPVERRPFRLQDLTRVSKRGVEIDIRTSSFLHKNRDYNWNAGCLQALYERKGLNI